jgi:predicted DNA-binding transcriptional regulator AlpA
MNTEQKQLNETEVAKLIGLHVQTLRNQRCACKGFPYLKIGRAVRYDPKDIREFLDARRINPLCE